MRCASCILLVILAAAACSSTKPCPPPPAPNIVYQEVYRCPDLGDLPPVVLPIPPPFPAGLEALPDWCVDVRDTVDAREKILLEAIEARDALIELMLTPSGSPP